MNNRQLWWLSFADDTGNRGCCIVEAPDFLSAVSESHKHGCNGGGEVKGWNLPADSPAMNAEIDRWGLNRLITPEEMIAADDYVNANTGEKVARVSTKREPSNG